MICPVKNVGKDKVYGEGIKGVSTDREISVDIYIDIQGGTDKLRLSVLNLRDIVQELSILKF
ncbi:hypothetical protein BPIT_29050 [Candidatus Brocadia pituitae]|nr:hypothetical protein BPIT_29050 [Candidatus Brocadia pituitae]